MKSLILISLIILSSCSAKIVPVQVALTCPDPLVLPKLPEALHAEAGAMSADLSAFFTSRDKLQTARRETLQNICRSTQ